MTEVDRGDAECHKGFDMLDACNLAVIRQKIKTRMDRADRGHFSLCDTRQIIDDAKRELEQ